VLDKLPGIYLRKEKTERHAHQQCTDCSKVRDSAVASTVHVPPPYLASEKGRSKSLEATAMHILCSDRIRVKGQFEIARSTTCRGAVATRTKKIGGKWLQFASS
jgi:hypothetical protein